MATRYMRWRSRQGRGLDSRTSCPGSIAKSKSTVPAGSGVELAGPLPVSWLASWIRFSRGQGVLRKRSRLPGQPGNQGDKRNNQRGHDERHARRSAARKGSSGRCPQMSTAIARVPRASSRPCAAPRGGSSASLPTAAAAEARLETARVRPSTARVIGPTRPDSPAAAGRIDVGVLHPFTRQPKCLGQG